MNPLGSQAQIGGALGRAAGAPKVKLPSEVASAVVWFDFNDATTLFTNTAGTTGVSNNGDTIRRINSKIGSIAAVNSNSTVQYTVNAYNSKSVGRFSTQGLLLNAEPVSFSQPTIMAIVKNNNANNRVLRIYNDFGVNATVVVTLHINPDNSSTFIVRDSNNVLVEALNPNSAIGSLKFFMGRKTIPKTISNYENGIFISQGQNASYNDNQIFSAGSNPGLGCVNGVSNLQVFDGDIGDFVILNNPSVSDINAISAYFADKWALTIIDIT